MIRKEARTDLPKPVALLALQELKRKLPGAKIELIEQDNELWTVTAEWDDGQPAPG